MSINLKKHLIQIKKGGIKTFLKKLKTLFYLLIQSPLYLFSIPLLIIIYLLRPWLLIRWYGLSCSRIGHFALDVELYSCRRDAKINQPTQKYIDIFFLGSKYICNNQLLKMLRRNLTILPAFLIKPLFEINQYFSPFIKKNKEHEIDIDRNEDRDVHNIVDKFNPHLSFNKEEKLKGEKILNDFGVPENAKFICLIVRDSAYLDRYNDKALRDFSYHNYRDCNIENFLIAAEELANRGYYVFRMGVKVHKPLKSTNPKIIDYANSKMRSEFMDIYLGANCTFCISTACGFDAIPYIFRKPIAMVFMPFGHLRVDAKKNIYITKHHINKKSKNKLTISEIFDSNVALSFFSEEYQNNNIELEENTPEEIKDLVTEMDERISGDWKETEEDLLLQKKFWDIFENNLQKLSFQNYKNPKPISFFDLMYLIPKRAKYSANFLRNNQDWIK